MLNLKEISKEELKYSLEMRGLDYNLDEIFQLNYELIRKKKELDELRHKRNLCGEKINIEEGREIKKQINLLNKELGELEEKYKSLIILIPNILDKDVKYGEEEKDDEIIKEVGKINFKKHHYEMDFLVNVSEMAGSRFIGLKGKFAALGRSLISYYMDSLLSEGFTEYYLPFILNKESFERSRHLPKDEKNLFWIEEDKCLIPTGEVPLVNIGYKARLEDLPFKICTTTPCFRKEAGAAGKDTRGMIRLHQFYKTEMVIFSPKDKSKELLKYMVEVSSKIVEGLGLPYQITRLCSKEMPLSSMETFDIKAPIGGVWREIASISNCGNYQSISLDSRDKNSNYLHILNGSALPMERVLSSLIENYYEGDKIIIPEILRKYLPFSHIEL